MQDSVKILNVVSSELFEIEKTGYISISHTDPTY